VTTDTRAHQARPTTDVDHIANNYLDALVELSPITATYLGITGHDKDIDDFSPSSYAAHSKGHDIDVVVNSPTRG